MYEITIHVTLNHASNNDNYLHRQCIKSIHVENWTIKESWQVPGDRP